MVLKMQKELNIQGDKYIAYSQDNVNWVIFAVENVIPEFDVITDNQDFNAYLTTIARDGIVESIKALALPIAKPKVEYYQSNKDFSKKNQIRYIVNYFDNDYYVRTKIDRQKRRLAYYFYKNKDNVAKLLKFNKINWVCEDFYE